MKRNAFKLFITLLVSISSIIIGSCVIGFVTKPALVIPGISFEVPVALYVLNGIVWIGAFIIVLYNFIKNAEKQIFRSIVAVLLFFFLLFGVTIISIFIVYAIHQNKNFINLALELIRDSDFTFEDCMGLLAVLLSFGSILAVLSLVIQFIRQKVRAKHKIIIGIGLSILAVAAVIGIEEIIYSALKSAHLISIRKYFDVMSALAVLSICAVIQYRTNKGKHIEENNGNL